MNHFQLLLNDGESAHHQPYHDNEQIYDKSTNQSNLISISNEAMNSPFDSSPKASMFFFSLNSPRQNVDNFQFNNHFGHNRKNSKDHIQPITRRLQFQEDQSLFCQEDQQQSDPKSIQQEGPSNISSQNQPQKTKKVKKSENCKGLKNLSIGVFQIVNEKGQTSYKEVANTLIEKLKRKSRKQKVQQEANEYLRKVDKDQHNVKRRVYDALNVLISAQLLRKQGKKVILNDQLIDQKREPTISQEYSRISSHLQMQKQVLEQKRKQLQKLKLKYERIQNLMKRNMKLGLNYTKVLKLPFIVAKSNIESIISLSIRPQQVDIIFNGKVVVMGDIDTIQQIEKPSHSLSRTSNK